METDPALHTHHHLASSYRALQPSLQSHQPQHQHHVQHQPQQHNLHHHGHPQHAQHSPHQGYAPQHGGQGQGLDLSGLVNEEYHDLQRLQVGHAQFQQHGHAYNASERHGHAHLQHDPQAHEQHQLVGHHTGHQEHGHHAQSVQQHEHEHQQQEHAHPGLRPYPLMHQQHQGGEHAMQMQQEDVFGSHTPHTPHLGVPHTQGDAHLAPAPATQLENEKVKVELRGGRLGGDGEKKFRVVPNPPNLEAWRQKLFDVNEMITLSEDEYYTYFPHVDNVYSHRSTQKYKRKPFVSHYWDCRLKGRPPGTKKSEDPEKKKRKRMARERDLCDVKIKITEYFGGMGEGEDARMQRTSDAQLMDGQQGEQDDEHGEGNSYYASNHSPHPAPQLPPSSHTNPNLHPSFQSPLPQQPPLPQPSPNSARQSIPSIPTTPRPGAIHPGANGARYFTIQRVNGNGGNGKGDGVAGPHKHSLEDSDKIKKNSVIRSTLRDARELKRASGTVGRGGSVGALRGGGDGNGKRGGKVSRATGAAAATVKRHSKAVKDEGVIFFGDPTDVRTQRCWIALEILKMPYMFVECAMETGVDERLREVCGSGRPETVKLPGIRRGNWGVWGERVCLEYLNEVVEKESVQGSVSNGPAAGKPSAVPGRKVARTASMPNTNLSVSASPSAPASAFASAQPLGTEKIEWAGSLASSASASDPLSSSTSVASHPYLLPPDPRDRAYARQWAAFIDEEILPAYDAYLSHSSLSHSPGQGTTEREEVPVPASVYEKLQTAIIQLVAAAHPIGPFFAGLAMTYVDVVFAPVVVRIGMLLVGGNGDALPGGRGRGWRAPQPGTRWESWVKALEGNERVRATCCEAGTYEAAWVRGQERRAAGEHDLKGRGGDGI